MVNYLHPPTHQPTRIIKKIGFQKGGLPAQNRRLKFRSLEQYPKRESIGPHGSASASLREIKNINYCFVTLPEKLALFCRYYILSPEEMCLHYRGVQLILF